jgi:hypothetical protein
MSRPKRVVWELYHPGGATFHLPADPDGFSFEELAVLRAAAAANPPGTVVHVDLPEGKGRFRRVEFRWVRGGYEDFAPIEGRQ